MSACAAPNGNTADDWDPNVLQIQMKKKKNICIQQLHQVCINTPRSNPHVDCWMISRVMKFFLQNPQVLRVSGRDKRPGRKSNLFHRVIIFHVLQLLPELGGKNGKLGLLPPNAARRALCPLAPLPCLAASQGWALAQLQRWHPAHWFREGKARKRHPSTSRKKNAQGCDPKLWEKGCRAPLVIPLPQVMPVGTWASCLLWASGLAARYLLAMF